MELKPEIVEKIKLGKIFPPTWMDCYMPII
jgi:hypothetical protein